MTSTPEPSDTPEPCPDCGEVGGHECDYRLWEDCSDDEDLPGFLGWTPGGTPIQEF